MGNLLMSTGDCRGAGHKVLTTLRYYQMDEPRQCKTECHIWNARLGPWKAGFLTVLQLVVRALRNSQFKKISCSELGCFANMTCKRIDKTVIFIYKAD